MTVDEASVWAVEEAYDQAWCRGDLDGLMGCLTADAVVVNPRGEVAIGASEIREALGGFLAGEGSGTNHQSTLERISVVTDAVVVVDGQAVLSPRAGGMHQTTLTHAFTDVLRRSGDSWLIAHVRAYGMATRPDLPNSAAS